MGNLAAVTKAVKLSRAIFRKIKQSLFGAFFYSMAAISTTSHPDQNGWHNHMPGRWGWGWPLMIILWILGILLIVLLAVSITKILKK